MKGHINTLLEIDVAAATFSDIRWHYGTFNTLSSGEGRNKTYTYRNGVKTDLGDIEESVWYRLAEAVICREGEQQILSWLIEWESEHNYSKEPPAMLRQQALKSHAARIFDCPQWVHYVPFNKRYRPDVYAQAHIVSVVNTCCKKIGEVTQEQIDRAYEGTVCCPHCGRWSTFIIPDKREAEHGPCQKCDCNDPDMGCTMPSIDRNYACPIYDRQDEPTADKHS
ncbi:MAG: hypothetical protein PHY23_00375 [Oscillospiraceae bacterium]|nr:hypothetical protein [Oscillospiraceae bacterium]